MAGELANHRDSHVDQHAMVGISDRARCWNWWDVLRALRGECVARKVLPVAVTDEYLRRWKIHCRVVARHRWGNSRGMLGCFEFTRRDVM